MYELTSHIDTSRLIWTVDQLTGTNMMGTLALDVLNRQLHCVKSVRIRSYSDPYSVRMRENTDHNNSEYGHFLRSVKLDH